MHGLVDFTKYNQQKRFCLSFKWLFYSINFNCLYEESSRNSVGDIWRQYGNAFTRNRLQKDNWYTPCWRQHNDVTEKLILWIYIFLFKGHIDSESRNCNVKRVFKNIEFQNPTLIVTVQTKLCLIESVIAFKCEVMYVHVGLFCLPFSI